MKAKYGYTFRCEISQIHLVYWSFILVLIDTVLVAIHKMVVDEFFF